MKQVVFSFDNSGGVEGKPEGRVTALGGKTCGGFSMGALIFLCFLANGVYWLFFLFGFHSYRD